jgi:hypothetical protein
MTAMSPRVRPVFEQVLPDGGCGVFFGRLAEELDHAEGRCRGHVFDGGAILRIRHEDRRIWSPALTLTEHQGALRGQFSPSSPVWTAFVGIYIALLCVAIAGACYGWAQTTLDETPWAFAAVPAAVLLAGFTYGAAFIGQGLGAADMHEMRSFVERVAERARTGQLER